MKILVLNGPNLSTLGKRQPEIYGTQTLAQLEAALRERAHALGCQVQCIQSNHEGALIDHIEREGAQSDGIILNPGGLTHTSVALYDALRACQKPVVEVHLSNLFAREEYRQRSVTAAAAVGIVSGLGFSSYLLALEYLATMHARGG